MLHFSQNQFSSHLQISRGTPVFDRFGIAALMVWLESQVATHTIFIFKVVGCCFPWFLSARVKNFVAVGQSCTVIPESLVLLLDGVYSPRMKGANWLKFICHQGRSLVNNFSLCNNLYKSVVLSLIWLHSIVCQIHNKQMSQLVAYSGNICVWVVSCNECGGWGLGRRSASIKKGMVPMATFMKESRSNVVASQ